jgi:hypothetical protein
MFLICSLLHDVFINSNYKASNEWMIVNYKRERVCKEVVATYSNILFRNFYGEIKENRGNLRHDSQCPDRYSNRVSHEYKSEAFSAWTKLLTRDSELQVITALSLISTLHKSPQHPLSLFQPALS